MPVNSNPDGILLINQDGTLTFSVADAISELESDSTGVGTTAADGLQRIEACRSVLERGRSEVIEAFQNGASGPAVCGMLSDLVDGFVRVAFERVFHGGRTEGVPALMALGGYGRRELHLRADVDILWIVNDAGVGSSEEDIASVLQELWDLGFDLGHSTRSISECLSWASEDQHFATALLERRLVVGNTRIADELGERYRTWLAGDAGAELESLKINERRKRLELFQGTTQVKVPNVKESPGSLRDVHFIRWLHGIRTGRGEPDTVPGILGDRDGALLSEIHAALLRIRTALHVISDRKSDLLDHLVLPELATSLGYTGAGAVPVERLMHDYYRNASRIARLAARVDAVMTEQPVVAATHTARTSDGILIGSHDIALETDAPEMLVREPGRLARLFAVAGAHNLRIAGGTAAMVEDTVGRLPDDIASHPDVRRVFHDILNLRRGVARTFRLMHEHGFLTRLIPEFSEIGWHYQYDFYHAYTTDEHSFRVVEHLESFAGESGAASPELVQVMAEVPAQGALYLAGLLHDVGKAKGHGHSKRGEVIAARVLRRLGFDKRTVDLVRFLIREHLLMSHISQRRDMDDDETIADLMSRVDSAGRLRMLLLLTFGDLLALSSDALTEWKRTLLWELYERGLAAIEHRYELGDARTGKQAIAAATAALNDPERRVAVSMHLGMLPTQYTRITRTSMIERHLHGIDHMRRRGSWASFRRRGDLTHLTVIVPDSHYVLADICGAITSSDINIAGARIFTRTDGVVIDTFLVVDAVGEPVIPRDVQRAFKDNLLAVLSRRETPMELIARHSHRWRRRKTHTVYAPPRVRILNDLSSRYTIIDVFATDYTGLLYDVTSVLASFSAEIHTARIGTDEDQVVDAFYVQTDGEKITDEKVLRRIEAALLETLSRDE
jgi:[protein-PII] uridylyltransferase